jgi:hypothetical protein
MLCDTVERIGGRLTSMYGGSVPALVADDPALVDNYRCLVRRHPHGWPRALGSLHVDYDFDSHRHRQHHHDDNDGNQSLRKDEPVACLLAKHIAPLSATVAVGDSVPRRLIVLATREQ